MGSIRRCRVTRWICKAETSGVCCAGAFSNAGGNVTYIRTSSFGTDGHQLFSAADGIPVWSPIVDRFLMSNSLVLREKLIDVRSPDVPVPSGLNIRGREAFKNYLDSGPNKAFAVGGDLHFGWPRAAGRSTRPSRMR
jgi:hypothetical protein